MSLPRSLEKKLKAFSRSSSENTHPEWNSFFAKLDLALDEATKNKHKSLLLSTDDLKPEDVVEISKVLTGSGLVVAQPGVNYSSRALYIRIIPNHFQ